MGCGGCDVCVGYVVDVESECGECGLDVGIEIRLCLCLCVIFFFFVGY